MWCPFAANVFSEFLLLLFRDMRLIFLSYGFSKHVHISVLSLYACLWDSVLLFLYSFHSVMLTFDWRYVILFSLILCISALLDTVKSNSKDRKESNSKERAGLKLTL